MIIFLDFSLKNDTNLEMIFKKKKEQNKYIKFWNLAFKKYMTAENVFNFG